MARTTSMAALSAALFSLFTSTVAGQSKTCPTNGPLSCQNTTAVADTCCFNAPGGSLLQTQFWDYNPSTGPANSWTIHGLWPDHCDGTYDANCDASRAYTNITQILQSFGDNSLLSYMQTYWPDYQGNNENFWEHEWGKHGTCISTLNPSCYTNYQPTQEVPDFFNRTVSLFQTLNSYAFLQQAGIVPSNSQTYSLTSVQNALANGHNGYTPVVRCTSGAINEIWYYFNVQGSVQTGNFVAVGSDGSSTNCPATVSYIPKSGAIAISTSSSTSTPPPTSTSSTATVTSTGGSSNTGALSGKGYLNVVDQGSQNGCLISSGKWYTTGTCATYTATASGSNGGFTLKGSKGYCNVLSDGTVDCTQSSGGVFTASGNTLLYSGSSNFYAAAAAAGSTQQTVYTTSHSEPISIQWQGQ